MKIKVTFDKLDFEFEGVPEELEDMINQAVGLNHVSAVVEHAVDHAIERLDEGLKIVPKLDD